MGSNRVAIVAAALGLAACVACNSGELPVTGRVLVDGAPLDSGTVRFDPVDPSAGKGAGGMVEGGVLQLPDDHGLATGRYRVMASAFKKTGKVIQDYQRGKVEEMTPLVLADSPQEIDLSPDNAQELVINFTTAQRR